MKANPVLRGFSPDPSIVRVGADYYIATSTFEWFPGVRLHRSRDLENWTEIKAPLTRGTQLDMTGDPNSGGVWAPDISYREGIFYLAFTDVKSKTMNWYNTHNYLVWTDDIEGEWSEPVYLNSTGFDPSLFHDTDGKTWLVNMRNGFKGILLQELDLVRKKLIGPVRNIYAGTVAGYTEGPHLYKRGGFYYLVVAEGGTGYGHRVTVARSRSLFGPFETMGGNPLLTSSDDPSLPIQKAGHADLVETPDGEWYMAFLCSRPVPGHGKCVLGRETGIEKIVWDGNHWPALERGGWHPGPASADTDSEYFDSFGGTVLDAGWKSLRVGIDEDISLTARPGSLRLAGRESINSLAHVALLARKQEGFRAEASVILDYEPSCSEQMAGLAYMYDNAHFYLLAKSRRDDGEPVLILLGCDAQKTSRLYEAEIGNAATVRLSVRTDSTTVRFFWDRGNGEAIEAGPALDASILSDEYARGFTGAHFALYCHDLTGMKKTADFISFSLKTLA